MFQVFCLFLSFSIRLENNIRNPLHAVKSDVIGIITRPIDTPIADTNDAVVTLPLPTEGKIKLISENSGTLLIYIYAYVLFHIFFQ